MHIKSICASLPSTKITNDHIIDLIQDHSKKCFSGDLNSALKLVRAFLRSTGIQSRYWCNDHELPIDHVCQCINQVLQDANLKANDIDLLIYTSIGRGFIEPANSYLVAKAAGLLRADCFDVVDACMGWIRALKIIKLMFANNEINNALVVNAECNIKHGFATFEDIFTLHSLEGFQYTFPRFTVGEACSATLLLPDDCSNFDFHFSSKPSEADLCTFPITPRYQGFCNQDDKIAKNGACMLTAYGKALHDSLSANAVPLFNTWCNKSDIDIAFVHTSSQTHWTSFGKAVGIADKIHHVYSKTGNIASAAMPFSLYDAWQANKLQRTDKMLFWAGSAGMSFNVTKAIF